MAWRQHGHAKVDASSPSAFGVCDRCGRLFNYRDLIKQFDWRGPRLMWLGIFVCREDLDKPQEQLRPIVLPPDPLPVLNPRPEAYAAEDGGLPPDQATLPPIEWS